MSWYQVLYLLQYLTFCVIIKYRVILSHDGPFDRVKLKSLFLRFVACTHDLSFSILSNSWCFTGNLNSRFLNNWYHSHRNHLIPPLLVLISSDSLLLPTHNPSPHELFNVSKGVLKTWFSLLFILPMSSSVVENKRSIWIIISYTKYKRRFFRRIITLGLNLGGTLLLVVLGEGYAQTRYLEYRLLLSFL